MQPYAVTYEWWPNGEAGDYKQASMNIEATSRAMAIRLVRAILRADGIKGYIYFRAQAL